MAKIYGLFGSMTGKVADVVMCVRNGEQIARKYQPVVSNPNTPGQVETRAKLKLLSQLSAVVAPVVAIPRQGSVSSRNLFTKLNFGIATYADDTASVNLPLVQLTKSVVALPGITAGREGSSITARLVLTGDSSAVNVDKVVYCLFEKTPDDKLRYLGSSVATAPGASNVWDVTNLPGTDLSCVVYAYGVRFNSEAARVKFGDLTTEPATQVAKLIVTRAMIESDVTLTETRGYLLAAANNS